MFCDFGHAEFDMTVIMSKQRCLGRDQKHRAGIRPDLEMRVSVLK